MQEYSIRQLVDEIRAIGVINLSDTPIPLSLCCQIALPVPWNTKILEETLGVVLPQELKDLWNQTSHLRLFEDITYGQWGLVLWSPEQVIIKHQEWALTRKDEFHPGDLIIGEFLGDSDLLMIRCNPKARDFASVMIVLPIDSRKDWYIAADSLVVFLEKFIQAQGSKFWE